MTIDDFLKIPTLKNFSEEESLNILGNQIDQSFREKRIDGLKKALNLCSKVHVPDHFKLQSSLAYYFISVAWSDIRQFQSQNENLWNWDHRELEKEIVNLRLAIKNLPSQSIEDSANRLCQFHTNLGNAHNFSGRFVAAFEHWDNALLINPLFGMAIGSKGNSMIYHSLNSLYDEGHQSIYLGLGYANLKKAIDLPLESNAAEGYIEAIKDLEKSYPELKDYKPDFSSQTDYKTHEEKQYRQWCLSRKLFLNPLNDLQDIEIADHDPFALPDMIIHNSKAGSFHSFFNQIKQEYIHARLLLFQGLNNDQEHFADNGVLKYDLFDSTVNTIRTEQIKTSYRISYSLFDKMAYFLNYYFELGIAEHKVNFRTVWFSNKNILRSKFTNKTNLMLRALYWVHKDLFYKENTFKSSLEPDAAELADIRNHLEHKSLRIFQNSKLNAENPDFLKDKLSYSIEETMFNSKTLKILRLARESLIYLSLSIRWEERKGSSTTSRFFQVPTQRK